MAGILDYNKDNYSTQGFRESILGRNLPPPVNATLTDSGLVSKLQDIGNVINVPINGITSENIPTHYDEEERMFPLGTFYRTTQNVNLNRFIPQNDDYITYELTIPPNLGYPLPEGFGDKVRGFYPISYNSDQFYLVNKGDSKGVGFPFNVIDTYKELNFQRESSLGLIGGQELEKSIINKIAQVEDEANDETPGTGNITPPIGNDGGVSSYVNRLRGSEQYFNTLPNGAVGWNEHTSINGNNTPDQQEGVEPTLSTEARVNTLLERTSVSQVKFLFDLINRNTYKPLYEDRRLQGTSEEGTNSRYYIGTDKNTNRGALITKTFDNKDFNGVGESDLPTAKTDINEEFFWKTGGEFNFNEKTLLSKTQELVNNSETDVFINQTKKYFKDKKLDRLISRGNAISHLSLIEAAFNGAFCRVWTVNDNYNYLNAIRNTGLFTSPNGEGFSATDGRSSLSVLMDNGIPKYHPVKEDSDLGTRKKYMFSIENLAWADNLADLPLSEIGPGDLLTGNKGRIMWFPPYELTFDENTSANWTATDFIGRSEPVYTYNNAKRSGQIGFKILVDHPRVINCYRGKSNNLIERFFAGCVTPDDFLNALECAVSQSDLEEIKKELNKNKKTIKTDIEKKSIGEKILFDVKTNINCEGITTENCFTVKRSFDPDTLSSLVSTKIKPFVEEQSTNSNPKVMITLNGYVGSNYKENSDGVPVATTALSKKNAQEVANQITADLGPLNKNVVFKVKGNDALDTDTDSDYRVEILAENDTENNKLIEPNTIDPEEFANSLNPEDLKLLDHLIIDETTYFDYIDGNYPNYFRTISDKIKYFTPAYHSITPEGLNSRLTFLNQCMRQGPSVNDSGTIQPQNLSFGRPPICIIRIGDFFHTKVAINSLSITYDGPQWDINPEGIGVQPMIATVSLSVDLIGGHSLQGPINRLQNAVSFNYYANTEMYDPRADYIKEGELIPGIKLGEMEKALLKELAEDYNENLKNELSPDQTKDNTEVGGGNSETGSGGPVLEIIRTSNNPYTISIKTTSGEASGDVEVNGEANENNRIYGVVKIGNKKVYNQKQFDSSIGITINPFEEPNIKDKIVDPDFISSLNQEISVLEDSVSTLELQVENNSGNPPILELIVKQDELTKKEKEKTEYLKSRSDSITVTGYLNKNKGTTTVNETFTFE